MKIGPIHFMKRRYFCAPYQSTSSSYWMWAHNLVVFHLYVFILPVLPSSSLLYVSCSESVLELSIMPKDEDVLQLVSVSMGFFMHLIPRATCITHSHTFHYIISQGCCVVLVCRVRHRSTSSPWKNVEIFLEWLHSDSEARCSVFRLQHAFIKSHWCPKPWKLHSEKQLGAHSHAHVLYNTFLSLHRLLHACSHDQTCIIPRPSH